jgi:hypothetical protein
MIIITVNISKTLLPVHWYKSTTGENNINALFSHESHNGIMESTTQLMEANDCVLIAK